MASTLNATTASGGGIIASGDSSGILQLQTGGTTAVTVDASQNVGVGTASPAYKLDIQNAGNFSAQLKATAGNYAQWSVVGNAGTTNFGTDNVGGYVQTVGAIPLLFYTSNTERMRLDSNGNLGVGGTAGSGVRLDVQTPNGTAAKVRWLLNGTDDWTWQIPTTGSFTLSNGATERLRVDGSGNLLVGQTSSGSPNANGFATNTSGWVNVNHANGTGGGIGYAFFGYNGSGIGSITQNGTTGVLYNLTSDYRLKNDQQPLTGAKEFVMALQPKKWQWWDGSGEGVGFIAHEFMEVAKYSGHGEKDAVDADGKPVYQSIQPSSSEVMANLVSLIQEQQTIITQLTTRIAALENK